MAFVGIRAWKGRYLKSKKYAHKRLEAYKFISKSIIIEVLKNNIKKTNYLTSNLQITGNVIYCNFTCMFYLEQILHFGSICNVRKA